MKDLIAVFGAILAIGAAILLNVSLLVGFVAAILWVAALFYGTKFSLWPEVKKYVQLYGIILLIGASVSAWLISGIVQTFTYYGIRFLHPSFILPLIFLMTAVVGYFMGTAVGTISTLGIAVIGVGVAFGIPAPYLVAAAVSGAFISDKLSPLSGLLNLTIATSGSSYKALVKKMLATILPVVGITTVLYGLLGFTINARTGVVNERGLIALLETHYVVHPLLFLVPVGIVILALMGRPTLQILLAGVAGGGLIGITVAGHDLLWVLNAIIFGYQDPTGVRQLQGLFRSGGVVGMVEVLFIVMAAIVLAACLEQSGVTTRLIQRYIKPQDKASTLVAKTGILSMVLTILTCDQTVGIVMPLKSVEAHAKDKGLSPEVLARTVSDTGTIIAPLMPWNVNGLIILSVTGISAVAYAPYAFLCWLMPLTLVAVVAKMNRTQEVPDYV